MSIDFAGNIVRGNPGEPKFIVATNITNAFELGDANSSDYWLQGKIVGPPYEAVFNGRLFLPSMGTHGTVIDNFPKSPAPPGWYVRPIIQDERRGYDLVSKDGIVLFGYEETPNKVCLVTVKIYDKAGNLVAETSGGRLIVHRGRVIFPGFYFS